MPITTKRPPADIVREWTIALGVLTSSGRMTADDAELKLKAYVPLLVENFPPAAFTQASLHHVAAKCKWFPSYAEVITHLRAWWREHRPITNALPAPLHNGPEPDRPPPTEEERDYVRRRVAEIAALLSGGAADHALRPVRDPGPRYLTPVQLDAVNPLPNGRKRVA
jgi:hypothetical protein